LAIVLVKVTSVRGIEAISSRLRCVSLRMDWVAFSISVGVKSQMIGGTDVASSPRAVDSEVAALVARARSTSVGSHVPQISPKLKDPSSLP